MKQATKTFLLAATVVSCLATASNSAAFSLEGTAWQLHSQGVDPNLLYAIALAESQREIDGLVRPWPWSLNVQGKGRYFETREEAEAFLSETLATGIRNVDIGPMQINYSWHGHRVLNPADLFDIQTSVRVGADILSEALASSPDDKELGVGRYHNWGDENRARKYGRKVLNYLAIILSAKGN